MAEDPSATTPVSGQKVQISDTTVSAYKTWNSRVAMLIPILLVTTVFLPEIATALVASQISQSSVPINTRPFLVVALFTGPPVPFFGQALALVFPIPVANKSVDRLGFPQPRPGHQKGSGPGQRDSSALPLYGANCLPARSLLRHLRPQHGLKGNGLPSGSSGTRVGFLLCQLPAPTAPPRLYQTSCLRHSQHQC